MTEFIFAKGFETAWGVADCIADGILIPERSFKSFGFKLLFCLIVRQFHYLAMWWHNNQWHAHSIHIGTFALRLQHLWIIIFDLVFFGRAHSYFSANTVTILLQSLIVDWSVCFRRGFGGGRHLWIQTSCVNWLLWWHWGKTLVHYLGLLSLWSLPSNLEQLLLLAFLPTSSNLSCSVRLLLSLFQRLIF